MSNYNEAPLRELATRFTALNTALVVNTTGRTIEFKNTSPSAISDINLEPVSGNEPAWVAAIRGASLDSGKARIILRQPTENAQEFEISWHDITEAIHRRRIGIKEVTA